MDDERPPARVRNRRERSEAAKRFMKRLGERIARAREAAGFTQEDLMPVLGFIHPTGVSAIELGRTAITPYDVATLAKYLHQSIPYFYGDVAKPTTLDDWLALSDGDSAWATRHHQLELSFREKGV